MHSRFFGLHRSYNETTNESRDGRSLLYLWTAVGGVAIDALSLMCTITGSKPEDAGLNAELLGRWGLVGGSAVVSGTVITWGVDRAITHLRDKKHPAYDNYVDHMDREALVKALGSDSYQIAVAAGNKLEDVIAYQVLPEDSE